MWITELLFVISGLVSVLGSKVKLAMRMLTAELFVLALTTLFFMCLRMVSRCARHVKYLFAYLFYLRNIALVSYYRLSLAVQILTGLLFMIICRNLVDMDVFSKSDPRECYIY